MNIGVCTNYEQAKLFIEELIEKNNEILEYKRVSRYGGEYMTDKNWYRILAPNSHSARGMRFHKIYFGIENSIDFVQEILTPLTILRTIDHVEAEVGAPLEFIIPNDLLFQRENELLFQREYECKWGDGGNLDGER